MGPARNLDRLENARLDQRLDRLSRIVGPEAEIVAQVLPRGDAERLSRALDEGALRVLLVRSRQSEDLGRNDALGQVVDPLEAAAPGRCRDVASPEEPLERLLGVAPFPPARPAALFFQVRRRTRTLVADAIEQRFRLGPPLAREQPQALPASFAAIRRGPSASAARDATRAVRATPREPSIRTAAASSVSPRRRCRSTNGRRDQAGRRPAGNGRGRAH